MRRNWVRDGKVLSLAEEERLDREDEAREAQAIAEIAKLEFPWVMCHDEYGSALIEPETNYQPYRVMLGRFDVERRVVALPTRN
jgi:hypothetical protein